MKLNILHNTYFRVILAPSKWLTSSFFVLKFHSLQVWTCLSVAGRKSTVMFWLMTHRTNRNTSAVRVILFVTVMQNTLQQMNSSSTIFYWFLFLCKLQMSLVTTFDHMAWRRSAREFGRAFVRHPPKMRPSTRPNSILPAPNPSCVFSGKDP